jgi:Lipase (class 3)
MSLNPGFNLSEALNLVALSAIVEGGDAPPQPVGWSMAFDSPVIGPFTEKWQLWKNDAGAYAVVLRDTVMTAGSIVEDLISFLAPAVGRLTVGHVQIDYIRRQYGRERPFRICQDPQNGILVQLADKVPQGSAIFIAGHSQEAAMATLLRSYHAYGADAPKDKNYSYKTYVFAQPKPGNDHYAADFESAFCKAGLAFRISNSLDWVPRSRLRLSFTSISPTSSAL